VDLSLLQSAPITATGCWLASLRVHLFWCLRLGEGNKYYLRHKRRSWVGKERQKVLQLLAIDDKWCTFWAALYLKILNINF